MSIQDKQAELSALALKMSNATPLNPITKADTKRIAELNVEIAAIAVAEFAENDATDAAQTAKDSEHDTEILSLKVAKKQAVNVFYVDRRYSSQAELIAQDGSAVQGSMEHPFGTPFGAMKAAACFLAQSPDKKAWIEVQKGNSYSMSDYVSGSHEANITLWDGRIVSIGGVLVFDRLNWNFTESTFGNVPLLSEAACAAFPNGVRARYSGGSACIGKSTNVKDEIYLRLEKVLYENENTMYQNSLGIVSLDLVQGAQTGMRIGDKWQATNTGNDDTSYKTLHYRVGAIDGTSLETTFYFSKLKNRTLNINVDEIKNNEGNVLRIGHWGANSNDGSGIGLENSVLRFTLWSYGPEAVMSTPNNPFLFLMRNAGNSETYINLPEIKTCKARFMFDHTYSQEGMKHTVSVKKYETFVSAHNLPMIELSNGGTYFFRDSDFISHSLGAILRLAQGVQIEFNNCCFKRSKSAPFLDLSENSTVTFVNCHFIATDLTQVMGTGTGRAIFKSCTSNVLKGTINSANDSENRIG